MNIYYIGGSPCSGKSTVTEVISKEYNLHYFKVDDHLDRYTKLAASRGKEICSKVEKMSAEETWMREPVVQCEEELIFYEEILEFIQEDLKQIEAPNGIITEGAAYLPNLAKGLGIPFDRYISITPSKEFQFEHYRKRDWVWYVLGECSDKEKAFDNWMNRDVLFAKTARQQCEEIGYESIINNGEKSVEEMIDKVTKHFGLKVE